MPANLTPQYKEAEQRFRDATSHEEKLAALREMMALLPKHKGTEKLQADLRRRMAKLEDEATQKRAHGAQRHDPGHVRHEGAGQWAIVGPPNAGKSALVGALTHAHVEVAAYPFTTRVPQPGMMPFEDVQVQLVDTPPFAPQHTEPYLPNLMHNASGILLMLDIASNALDDEMAQFRELLERARVRPAAAPRAGDVPPFVVDRPVRVVLNKTDLDPDGTFVALARETVGDDLPADAVSVEAGAGLEPLRETLYRALDVIRIYAKEPHKPPDIERPFVLPRGATIHDLARVVHNEIADHLRFARIWGSGKFDGQQVDRDHALEDRDVVELHA